MKNAFIFLPALVFFIFLTLPTYAEVALPSIISNNMVLQRDIKLPIWGWAEPGEEVSVKFNDDDIVSTKTGSDGKWMLTLPPQKAGGPYIMIVNGADNTITLNNILVGEVWICSGQSNMDRGVDFDLTAKDAIADAKYPQIRLFQVPCNPSGLPVTDVRASWNVCAPEKSVVGTFSAVGYFFGREIFKELGVPVGIIQSSVGGTRSEAWTPGSAFAGDPEFKSINDRIRKADTDYRKLLEKSMKRIDLWSSLIRKELAENKRIMAPPLPIHPFNAQNFPTVLFNGMINPIVPFAIRGAIWYQGEANRSQGVKYFEYMNALINGWRNVWNEGDFPFYYVQLAPYNYGPEQPYLLPELWEGQRLALSIPNTGMVVINDIGNIKDIHPKNKLDVGKRLAWWALAKTYGKTNIVYSGPLYKSMKVEGTKIRISFDYVGAGLKTRDGKEPDYFEIAGQNRKFVKASARIESDNTILVWNENITSPAVVRFAWHQEAEPNLMNKEGLPSSSFNTDIQLKK